MEKVNIWYLTDNDAGRNIGEGIINLGIKVNIVTDKNFKKNTIAGNSINIFIIDLLKKELSEIMSIIEQDDRLNNYPKFVFLPKKKIRQALNMSVRFLHVEFLSRPVDKREFALLLEKSIVVEKYRDMMKFISLDAEGRIETYENLMDISRRDLFVTDEVKEDFQGILNYEKKLMIKQSELNHAIKEYTLLRQKEMFYNKNRIIAEEMLDEFRRQEMKDARDVIQAQETVIDFSSSKLHEAHEVIEATEKAAELGRQEAVQLHKNLAELKEKNIKLEEEIKKLKNKLNSIDK